MRFGLLGPLEVSTDAGVVVDLGPRKQRAVLALLVLARGRVVALDRLVDELWADDEPPAQVTLSLQSYVARLRRILDPGRDPKQPSTVIVSRPPGWVLPPAGHEVDAVEFADRVGAARTRLGADPVRAANDLRAALALWRGPALAEFAHVPGAAVEATRLEELRVGAVEDLLDADLAAGRADRVVVDAEVVLAERPYRERVWQALLLALYRCDRQADALAAYRRARDLFADDLGVDPGPRLRELEQAILQQSPSLDRPAPTASVPVVRPGPAAERSTSAFATSTLAGRARESEHLGSLVQSVLGGNGQVLLLSGPAGIGKTALLDHARDLATAAGMLVAGGTAIDADPPPALWPWLSVLRAVADVEAGTLADALGDRGALAAALDPTLAQTLGVAPVGGVGDVELNRTRLLHGIVDALETTSRRHPLLVTLDDAHWADQVSLDLVAALAGRAGDAPLLLALAYRSDEIDGSPLARVLPSLVTGRNVSAFSLSGLDECAVAALLTAMSGRDDASTSAALHDRTGGNPLFVTEMIRMLSSERGLEPGRVRTDAAPLRVQQVLERRLRRLPDKTGHVLAAAAVEGREFHPDVVGAMVDMAVEEVFEWLDVAIVTGMLDEPRATVRTLRFSHDLVRQTLYDGVPALRRARMHAAAARALATRSDAAAATVAHHHLNAAAVVDPADVVPALVAAAAEAADAYAFDQAEALYGQALQLADAVPSPKLRDRLRLQVLTLQGALNNMRYGQGSERTLGPLLAMLPILARTAMTTEVVPALYCAGTGLVGAARLDDLVALADDAQQRAEPGHEQAIARVAHHVRGIAYSLAGRHAEAVDELEAALTHRSAVNVETFEGMGGWSPDLGLRMFASREHAVLGNCETAQQHLAAARSSLGDAANDFARLYVQHMDVWAHIALRAPEEVAETAAAMLRIAVSGGYAHSEGFARAAHGWARALTGDAVGVAEVAAVAANADSYGISAPAQRCHLGMLHGQALLAAGRPRDALAVVDEVLRAHAGESGLSLRHELHLVRARALHDLGDPGAVDAAEVALSAAEQHQARIVAAEARALISAPGGVK